MGIVKTDTGYRVLMLGQDEPRLVRPFDVEPTQDIATAIVHRKLYEIAEAQRVDVAFLEFVLREPPTHDGDDQDAHEGMMRLVRSVLDRSFHLCTNIASVGADLVISENITDGFHGVMAVAGGRCFDPAIREEVRPELDRRVSDARRAHRTPSAMTEDQRQMLLDLQAAAAAAIAADAVPSPPAPAEPTTTPDDLATREEFQTWVRGMAMNLGAHDAGSKVDAAPVQRAVEAAGKVTFTAADMGALIRERRLRVGLSQTKIAEILGISQAAVSSWETGVTFPQMPTLQALAAVLGCTTADLIPQTTQAPAWSAEVTPPGQRTAPDLETLLGDLAVPPEDKP